MRGLFDIRFGRLSLGVLAVVSAVATVLILTSANERSPAQLAALAALRDRPHPRTATVIAAAPTATSPAPAPSSGAHASPSGSSSGGSTPSASPPAASASSGATGSTGSGATTPAPTSTTSTTPHHTGHRAGANLPKVGHVFEVMLSDERYGSAFGKRSSLSYLRALSAKGTLLSGYRSLGRGELADELALVSGQAPNPDTASGCPKYLDFPLKAVANTAGIVPGRGCVYPETALTIGDEVSATGKHWGAYVADMGKDTCVHPNSGVADDVALPDTDPGYDTRHNPFIYFHSLLDLGDCATDDMDISHLTRALSRPSRTPAFTYLAPSACADGDPPMASSGTTTTTGTTTTSTSSTTGTTPTTSTTATTSTTTSTTTSSGTTPTTSTTSTTGTSTTGTAPTTPTAPAGCPAGTTSGPKAENAFLKQWIPRILRSAAYRQDGMLIVAFAHDGTGHLPRTGALVLSRWTPRGRTVATSLNPYALLRLGEQALRLKPLAHARTAPSIATRLLVKG